MSRRLVDTPYLDPHVLVDNFSARSTGLDGVRRFYAREGVVAFADDKNGMNAIAGELWLRPAATRRIGSYLDLQRPAVVGFQLRRDPMAPPLTAELGEDLYREFVTAADGTRHVALAGGIDAHLVAANEDPADPWPWQGSVSYTYVQRLARGQRTVGHAEVELRARLGADDTVEVAVILNRSEDLEFATRWLRWAFAANTSGWVVSPVSLPEDVGERLSAIDRALRALSRGEETLVASPGGHRIPPLLTEVAESEAEEGPSECFLAIMRSGQYQTDMTSVDVIAEWMGVTKSAISLINTYLSRSVPAVVGRGTDDVVIALRLKQTPRRDAHVSLAWHAGKVRRPDDNALTREAWDNWPSLTWDIDRKRAFLLLTWSEVVGRLKAEPDAPAGELRAAN